MGTHSISMTLTPSCSNSWPYAIPKPVGYRFTTYRVHQYSPVHFQPLRILWLNSIVFMAGLYFLTHL
jgi:hypothetical protein